ncbi:MAG: archaeal proteasome endopeptidase complex subunit alpha [Candidatus Anstonellaceae archaeon]
MYPAATQGYDRAITIFSPDGRLFQVEYAKEAVKRGSTAIGIVAEDGVCLVAHKNAPSKLIVPESVKKIFEIDNHIAATAAGLIADARRLVDNARLEAQRHEIAYGEKIKVEAVAKELCDLMQAYTQYGGVRPFGVSLLIAGIDEQPRVFEAEPSGALTGYNACAIGADKKEVEEFLEKEYNEKIKLDEAIALSLKAIRKNTELRIDSKTIEIAVCTTEKKKFVPLNEKEIEKYLKT